MKVELLKFIEAVKKYDAILGLIDNKELMNRYIVT
jgi:hypothetical protein